MIETGGRRHRGTHVVEAAKLRRRRDPPLLLPPAGPGRGVPHVPRRDRGDPEDPGRLHDSAEGGPRRQHADRSATPAPRTWSSCSSTIRSTAPSATRRASASSRTSPTAGTRDLAFIEPKRHFRKPLELSPLIAIDRERCILCYRCVRFSQEISEDYQLILSERGAHSYVSTFDGHPYVAPFSGNIIELCPVGALTSIAYRFRARPWDIEGAGTDCTYCPAQCNVELTVRDDRVMRVLARDHDEVDDGWLCDKGRFA